MAYFSFHGGHSGEFCRHAKGTLRDVVQRAWELGFSTYGLAEHCPRYRAMDLFPGEEDLGIAGLGEQFRRYVSEAKTLQAEYQGRLEVLVGFETEVIPADAWLTNVAKLRQAHGFDFVIGSVHTVFERPIDLNAEMTDAVMNEAGGWDALCARYFESVIEVASKLRPEVAGHLDLIRRFRGDEVDFSPAVWPLIERALVALEQAGTLMEVNAAPFRRGFGPVYPGLSILRRAQEIGVRVTLGDDSHGPHDVGGGLDACLDAIRATGYKQVHYLTKQGNELVAAAAPLDEVRPGPRSL